jgi:transcription-repair coupling factor (superfamily II helicase)
VIEAGKQVAILCPTTVLAFQHHLTFRDRFAGFPVRVEMLSRFSSGAEERAVLAGLKSGEVDVVIGTTRLLGRGVRFDNLGLMVIDEEHRFGVRQKTRLKKMRTEVDVLAMSATPIPRTLQMAIGGLREMSIMATPPQDRLAVRTSVARYARTRVRDAILQELGRKGQVFFIHNRVETIRQVTEELSEWIPEARFATAHGQMNNDDLESVLVDFMQRRYDVLVSTAIVESGVDLPDVNTILTNRADMFGLSQLYQLRGRVGRSTVRANCVLLVPEDMTRDARRRVQVILENSRLGSGFSVASADLELRGGGNFLGSSQHGNIDAVGYDMWVELLAEAVQTARGRQDRERIQPDVEVPVPAFLPEQLISDVPQRLSWYRRISSAPTVEAVDALLEELEDQYGDLEPEVRNLGGLVQTRLTCVDLGIIRCSWLKVRVVLVLHPTSPLLGSRLDEVTRRHSRRFEVNEKTDGTQLSVRFTPQEANHPFRYLRWVFAQLQRTEE